MKNKFFAQRLLVVAFLIIPLCGFCYSFGPVPETLYIPNAIKPVEVSEILIYTLENRPTHIVSHAFEYPYAYNQVLKGPVTQEALASNIFYRFEKPEAGHYNISNGFTAGFDLYRYNQNLFYCFFWLREIDNSRQWKSYKGDREHIVKV